MGVGFVGRLISQYPHAYHSENGTMGFTREIVWRFIGSHDPWRDGAVSVFPRTFGDE